MQMAICPPKPPEFLIPIRILRRNGCAAQALCFQSLSEGSDKGMVDGLCF